MAETCRFELRVPSSDTSLCTALVPSQGQMVAYGSFCGSPFAVPFFLKAPALDSLPRSLTPVGVLAILMQEGLITHKVACSLL